MNKMIKLLIFSSFVFLAMSGAGNVGAREIINDRIIYSDIEEANKYVTQDRCNGYASRNRVWMWEPKECHTLVKQPGGKESCIFNSQVDDNICIVPKIQPQTNQIPEDYSWKYPLLSGAVNGTAAAVVGCAAGAALGGIPTGGIGALPGCAWGAAFGGGSGLVIGGVKGTVDIQKAFSDQNQDISSQKPSQTEVKILSAPSPQFIYEEDKEATFTLNIPREDFSTNYKWEVEVNCGGAPGKKPDRYYFIGEQIGNNTLTFTIRNNAPSLINGFIPLPFSQDCEFAGGNNIGLTVYRNDQPYGRTGYSAKKGSAPQSQQTPQGGQTHSESTNDPGHYYHSPRDVGSRTHAEDCWGFVWQDKNLEGFKPDGTLAPDAQCYRVQMMPRGPGGIFGQSCEVNTDLNVGPDPNKCIEATAAQDSSLSITSNVCQENSCAQDFLSCRSKYKLGPTNYWNRDKINECLKELNLSQASQQSTQQGQFSNLTADLKENRARFEFAYSGPSQTGELNINLGVNPDLRNGTYLTFLRSEGDYTISSDLSKNLNWDNVTPKQTWQEYGCGKTFYWRVNLVGKVQSPIQGPVTVVCDSEEKPEFKNLEAKFEADKITLSFDYTGPDTKEWGIAVHPPEGVNYTGVMLDIADKDHKTNLKEALQEGRFSKPYVITQDLKDKYELGCNKTFGWEVFASYGQPEKTSRSDRQSVTIKCDANGQVVTTTVTSPETTINGGPSANGAGGTPKPIIALPSVIEMVLDRFDTQGTDKVEEKVVENFEYRAGEEVNMTAFLYGKADEARIYRAGGQTLAAGRCVPTDTPLVWKLDGKEITNDQVVTNEFGGKEVLKNACQHFVLKMPTDPGSHSLSVALPKDENYLKAAEHTHRFRIRQPQSNTTQASLTVTAASDTSQVQGVKTKARIRRLNLSKILSKNVAGLSVQNLGNNKYEVESIPDGENALNIRACVTSPETAERPEFTYLTVRRVNEDLSSKILQDGLVVNCEEKRIYLENIEELDYLVMDTHFDPDPLSDFAPSKSENVIVTTEDDEVILPAEPTFIELKTDPEVVDPNDQEVEIIAISNKPINDPTFFVNGGGRGAEYIDSDCTEGGNCEYHITIATESNTDYIIEFAESKSIGFSIGELESPEETSELTEEPEVTTTGVQIFIDGDEVPASSILNAPVPSNVLIKVSYSDGSQKQLLLNLNKRVSDEYAEEYSEEYSDQYSSEYSDEYSSESSGSSCNTSCGINNGENCTNQNKADIECAEYYEDSSTCSFDDPGERGDGCTP